MSIVLIIFSITSLSSTTFAKHQLYAQCGGINSAAKADAPDPVGCGSGLKCEKLNEYFWQCLPDYGSGSNAKFWEQCGGKTNCPTGCSDCSGEWKQCNPGSKCVKQSDWYSLCVPDGDPQQDNNTIFPLPPYGPNSPEISGKVKPQTSPVPSSPAAPAPATVYGQPSPVLTTQLSDSSSGEFNPETDDCLEWEDETATSTIPAPTDNSPGAPAAQNDAPYFVPAFNSAPAAAPQPADNLTDTRENSTSTPSVQNSVSQPETMTKPTVPKFLNNYRLSDFAGYNAQPEKQDTAAPLSAYPLSDGQCSTVTEALANDPDCVEWENEDGTCCVLQGHERGALNTKDAMKH